jgi:manganese transport protein
LTLVFAVVPLVQFTSSKAKMGRFVNGLVVKVVAVLLTIIIGGLNAYLVVQSIVSGEFGSTTGV